MKDGEVIMDQELANVSGGRKANYEYYIALEGDTLWSVAQKYNTTVENLLRLNCWDSDYELHAGVSVLVPFN